MTPSPIFTLAVIATLLTVLVALNPFGRNLAAPHDNETAKVSKDFNPI
jgi:hypothetical protein